MENIKYSLNGSFGVIQNREKKHIAKTEDLLIKVHFVLPNEYRIKDKYKVSFVNGNLKKQLSLEDLSIEVPQEFIISGELKITLSHLVNGRVSKNWICESLYIVESDIVSHNFVDIVPEVVVLKDKIVECENKIEKFNKKIELLTKLVYSICEIEPKGE